MNDKNSQNELDPGLQALFDAVQDVPQRDLELAAQSRAKYIDTLDEMFAAVTQPSPRISGWQQLKNWLAATQSNFQQRAALTALVVVVTVLAFLFGSAGITAYAAQSALPGDALYGVKTGLEQTQASLAGDAARKVELYLGFAERRLDEIARLIDEGRYADIQLATSEYQAYIQSALDAMKAVAVGDPLKASELAGRITELLTRYSQVLNGMLSNVPETARSGLEEAIQSSQFSGIVQGDSGNEVQFVAFVEQISSTVWVIGGRSVRITAQTEIKDQIEVGSLVKVHALPATDGSLVAREIELVNSQSDNENANGNDNANGNANDNMNDDNDNANEDENENQNDNQNDNDGGNTNTDDDGNNNLNDDDESNGSDDHNVNDNNNDNSNNDDSSNSNDNGDSGKKDDDNNKP